MISIPSKLLLTLALVLPALALAAPAGEVEFAKGIGAAQSSGSPIPRALGQGVAIESGDTVTMGSNSFAVLKMTDGTRMTLRPNTAIKFDGYSYKEPNKPDSMFTSLLKGGVRMVTGLIAKSSPSAAKLTTATATVGIRGTDFDARICRTDCAADAGRINQKSETTNVAASARVASIDGQVYATSSDGVRRLVAEGGPIYAGDTVETANPGHVVLVFRDNTKATLQPGSQLRLDTYVYSSDNPAEATVALTLLRGGLRLLPGLIGQARPQAIRVSTPTAVAGLRGAGGLDIFSDPQGCAAGGAAGCTLVTAWAGEVVLNPGEANELVLPLGGFAVQEATGAAALPLTAPPAFMLGLTTPRPDSVPSNAEQLFSAQEINEGDPGLFVYSRDGHLSLTSGDKTIDIARGETGFLNEDSTRLVRTVVTPNFLEFDFIPRPDRLNPNSARLLDLAAGLRPRNVCR